MMRHRRWVVEMVVIGHIVRRVMRRRRYHPMLHYHCRRRVLHRHPLLSRRRRHHRSRRKHHLVASALIIVIVIIVLLGTTLLLRLVAAVGFHRPRENKSLNNSRIEEFGYSKRCESSCAYRFGESDHEFGREKGSVEAEGDDLEVFMVGSPEMNRKSS